MKKFSQAWSFNERSISRVLNDFEVQQVGDRLRVFYDGDCVSDTAITEKNLFFQSKSFKDLLLFHIRDYGIKPIFLGFNMKEGRYEFRFVGKAINVLNTTFLEYMTVTDSIDGSLALQLNFGLMHQDTNSIVIIDYNNPTASNRWRHGKNSFAKKTENIQMALKSFDSSIERTIKTLERIKDKKVSYKKIIEGLTEYDTRGNIKLGNRQKLIALSRKVKASHNIKDETLIEALKTPEGFLKSGLDFNINAFTLFLYYIDAYRDQNSSAVTRENNRILEVIFKTFENNSLQNKKNSIFLEKTGMDFDKFYNNHFNKLTWFLGKYTKDLDVAQDYANEAFIQGLDKIETYDSEKSKIHTWIYRIGENLVRKSFNDDQKLQTVSIDNNHKDDLSLLNLLPDKDNSIGELVLDTIDKKAEIIRTVIYNLAPKFEKYKKVLIMRELDNMHYQEIADKTGINISTVKSQICKGRKIVAAKVEKQFTLMDKEIMGNLNEKS